MVLGMATYDPWEVRDPAAVIDRVITGRHPEPGDVFVALLTRADSSDQQVLEVVHVHRGDLPERHEASSFVRDHALRLVEERPWTGSGWRPPQHLLVTVVCRSGRVVPGPSELFWLMAWRYANHLGDAFDGDVYLVTEHGWTGLIDRRAGFTPALLAKPRHLSLLNGLG